MDYLAKNSDQFKGKTINFEEFNSTTLGGRFVDVTDETIVKGFFGRRTKQADTRVDAYELKINPNNESFYLPHPDGGFV